MKNILIIISLLVGSLVFAQIAPPPPSIPTADNKVLIDELIKVTNFEKYVNDYCNDRISLMAAQNNWSEEKRKLIIKNIDFNQFKDTIYNSFSLYSKEDLISINKLFRKLDNRKRGINLVPMSDAIQQNLEGFAQSIILGE